MDGSRARAGWSSAAVAAVFSLALTAYALGDLPRNGWTVLDDHEILSWIGARDRLPPAELWRALSRTEVLDPSVMPRFRPVYYLARIGEAILFGKSVSLWYAARWAMCAASVFLAAYGALRYLAAGWRERGVLLAGLALVASRAYWTDAFARLGPSESYAILATSLAALGFVAIWAGDRRSRWYWACLAGTLVAAGSKENLLVLAVPLAVLAVREWRRLPTGLRVAHGAALALLVADAAWIVHVVAAAGADMYGHAATPGGRLALLGAFLARPEARLTVGAAALLGAGLLVLRRRGGGLPAAARPLGALAAVLAGAAALAATQFVFYAGTIPRGMRYDFPYTTAFDVALVAAALVSLRLAEAALARVRLALGAPAFAAGTPVAAVALAGVAAIALALAAGPGLAERRAGTRALRGENLAFQARFGSAVASLERLGATAVVLHARRGLDYESVVSIARHLTARGVRLPIYVAVAEGAEERAESAWEEDLATRLRTCRWMDRSIGGIAPVPPGQDGRCFAFAFSGASLEPCSAGVEIWPIDVQRWARGE